MIPGLDLMAENACQRHCRLQGAVLTEQIKYSPVAANCLRSVDLYSAADNKLSMLFCLRMMLRTVQNPLELALDATNLSI